MNYTERSEGVRPEYDIRTDRFEIAQEAMDKASKSIRAKREAKVVAMNKKAEEGKAQSIAGTEGVNPS